MFQQYVNILHYTTKTLIMAQAVRWRLPRCRVDSYYRTPRWELKTEQGGNSRVRAEEEYKKRKGGNTINQ